MHALHRIDPAAGRIGLAAPLVRGRQHEREIKQKSLTGAKTMAMTKREFLIGAAAAAAGSCSVASMHPARPAGV
jgi:hypothetical protein